MPAERAAHSADVDQIGLRMRADLIGDLVRDPVRARRDAAADALADDEDVRLEPPGAGAPARPRRDGVRLVDQQQRPVPRAELAARLEEAGLGKDDADVRQRRLHDEHRDVTMRQTRLDGGDVVELGHAGRLAHRHGRADVPAARQGLPVVAHDHERLVDGPVVAVREGHHLRTTGDHPGQSQRPAIGVGRGQAERPQRHPEASGQVGRHPLRIQAGHHRGDAALPPDALLDGGDGGGRRVAGHRSRVAEREVDVLVTVDVGDPVPVGRGQVERVAAGPLVHPGHGYPAEQVVGGLEGRPRRRRTTRVLGTLRLEEGRQLLAIDGCHRCSFVDAVPRCAPSKQVRGRSGWQSPDQAAPGRPADAPCRTWKAGAVSTTPARGSRPPRPRLPGRPHHHGSAPDHLLDDPADDHVCDL